MSLNVRVYPLTIASGATGSTVQRIEHSTEFLLYVPTGTAWNAGAGNSTLNLEGQPNSSVSLASMRGYSIATDPAGPVIYDLGNGGVPFVRLSVATAVSSTLNAYLIAPSTE
jgi:hypothetical protein